MENSCEIESSILLPVTVTHPERKKLGVFLS